MNINSTSNAASRQLFQQLGLTGTSGSRAASGANQPNSLGQQTFLKLMVTELQNQDPTSPVKSQDFIAQLAQFSSVAGINNLQKTVTGLASSLGITQSLQAASLVGHNALVPAKQAQLPTSGSLNGAVNLTSPAQQVVVGIYSPGGQLVNQINLGSQPSGLANFSWNGMDVKGTPMAAGIYTLRAEGNIGGKMQGLSTYVSAPVNSVTLGHQGGAITLGLGNGLGNVDLSQVREIS